MAPFRRAVVLALATAILTAACAGSSGTGAAEPADPGADGVAGGVVDYSPENLDDLYDPVAAGEPLPDGFRQLLDRDDIRPVYDPAFVAGREVDWADENLVIGVVLEDEPRAYPVGFLQRREMVIDNHRGIPTLVTW